VSWGTVRSCFTVSRCDFSKRSPEYRLQDWETSTCYWRAVACRSKEDGFAGSMEAHTRTRSKKRLLHMCTLCAWGCNSRLVLVWTSGGDEKQIKEGGRGYLISSTNPHEIQYGSKVELEHHHICGTWVTNLVQCGTRVFHQGRLLSAWSRFWTGSGSPHAIISITDSSFKRSWCPDRCSLR